MIFIKCKTADDMAALCKKIDDLYRNSDFPTRTQTEEAFGKMFEEMLGDLKGMIRVDRPGGGLLAPVRRGQRDGDVDARAHQRGGRAQGDRLQPAAGAVHGPDRGGAGRRAWAALIGSLGCKGLLRSRRHLAIHRRLSAVFLRSLEHRAPGPGRLAFDRLGQRPRSGVRAANLSVIDGLRRVI